MTIGVHAQPKIAHAEPARAPVMRLADLTLGYDRHPAVHHLSGRFEPGSLTAVVGPNGAGKSTLLKGLAGVLRPMSGHIDSGGLALRSIAFLPQQAELDRSFPITVREVVGLGLWRSSGAFRRMSDTGRHAVAEALEAVGLAGFETRLIGTLSGGQLQRALFARVLVQDAAVILLDEPFTAIDQRTAADLLALVQRWHAEARTVVAVLHDLDLVRRAFPQTLLLARDLVAWGPTATALAPERLLEARRMTEAPAPDAPICARDAA